MGLGFIGCRDYSSHMYWHIMRAYSLDPDFITQADECGLHRCRTSELGIKPEQHVCETPCRFVTCVHNVRIIHGPVVAV